MNENITNTPSADPDEDITAFDNDGLSDKERAFVVAYTHFGELTYGNKSESARKAGYSESFINQTAYHIANRPHVRKAIDERFAQHCMTANEALALLGEQARASIADFVTDGHIDLSKADDAKKTRFLKSIQEAGEKTGARIEMIDSQGALDKILRAAGQYKEGIVHSGTIGTGEDLDYSKLSDEELAELESLHEKAKANTPGNTGGTSPS